PRLLRAATQLFDAKVVADNNRMYHRIGRVGDPAVPPPAFSAAAQISHHADGGWTISDAGRAPARYDDRDIRISILWKARVRPGPEHHATALLTPELIAGIISADLVHSTYYGQGSS
ncbi:MAG: hypothetical protein ACRDND_31145, partial [Streptosporangiaceae bacterium]